jgi:hypothetical protein
LVALSKKVNGSLDHFSRFFEAPFRTHRGADFRQRDKCPGMFAPKSLLACTGEPLEVHPRYGWSSKRDGGFRDRVFGLKRSVMCATECFLGQATDPRQELERLLRYTTAKPETPEVPSKY